MLYKAIKNNENNVNIFHNSKYVSTVTLDTYKLNLTKKVNAGIIKVTKVNLKSGVKAIYSNDEERRLAHNQQSLSSYHNNPETVKYRKDTDKTLSKGNSKSKLVKANKEFYSQYEFNYFISLQHGFVLNYWDKNACKTSEDYQTIRQQDKYQIAKCYNEQQCLDEALAYIKRLTKNGIPIYDNYIITIHKSKYDNSYHAHIAINILDTTIVNVHTYLQNRWYKCQRKKQMVKKVNNKSELIGYMLEEKKRINGITVNTECNLSKFSNRFFNQDDITKDLSHSLDTYKHPVTISKLEQFKKAI